MSDDEQALRDEFRRKINKDGPAWFRSHAPELVSEARKTAALYVLAEYEENQSSTRHTALMNQGGEMLDLQRTGNRIQWGILGALIVTVVVTIFVAWWSKCS